MLLARGLTRTVGARTLFAGLDLDVATGSIVGVRGPSGTGKTLLLRLLAGLDPLEQGTVTLDGQPPEAVGLPAWRARVAYVAQGAPPRPGTPAELEATVARFASQRRARAAAAWPPSANGSTRPARWAQPLGASCRGERQRAHLAVALAGAPDVLLLDEPTAALDADAVARVEPRSRARPCGRTIGAARAGRQHRLDLAAA
ncbi:MAG: ABC transporter ATP-binding protein [Myxococcota bacterium]